VGTLGEIIPHLISKNLNFSLTILLHKKNKFCRKRAASQFKKVFSKIAKTKKFAIKNWPNLINKTLNLAMTF